MADYDNDRRLTNEQKWGTDIKTLKFGDPFYFEPRFTRRGTRATSRAFQLF